MLYKGKPIEELSKKELIELLKIADSKITHMQTRVMMYNSQYGKFTGMLFVIIFIMLAGTFSLGYKINKLRNELKTCEIAVLSPKQEEK